MPPHPDKVTPLKVGVIGTGHVGLITCVSMAALGHDVVGTDSDEEKIAELEAGRAPFYEPGLQELLDETMGSGRLRFTSVPAEAVADRAVIFICVGTPPRESGEASLVAVEMAARTVARHATGPLVVVEKSTVPAGTAGRIQWSLRRERPDMGADFDVVSNPEFLREGSGITDSLDPHRVLIGAHSDRAFEVMRRLYAPLADKGVRLIETDIATSELAKHACNAFLAMKISYANALARLCEQAGADVVAVAEVMGSDPRIGRAFLNAGIGYGGYCFPKDLQAFERLAAKLGYELPLLKEVERINDDAVIAAEDKIKEAVWNLEDKRIALLGLSYKPDTDDVRFSPALALARRLLGDHAIAVGYDPRAAANAKAELPELEIATDVYDALEGAHCAVICTEWAEFKDLDLSRVKAVMAYPIVVDGRNLFDSETMRAAGFAYYPTGRPAII